MKSYKSNLFAMKLRCLIIVAGLFLAKSVFAGNVVYSGQLLDSGLHPVVNASIKASGYTVITDEEGRFTFPSEKGKRVTAFKDGYLPTVFLLEEGKTYYILESIPSFEEQNVSEIYNDRPRSRITTSTGVMMENEISRNSVGTFSDVLLGRIPGLYIKQGSGAPGSRSPQSMFIRGKHTYTGSNAPLVLVDGFERKLEDLSVDEVESISVLKDAVATALYGMDAANGIILVKTKQGKKEGIHISFKSEWGVEQPLVLPQFYSSYDFAKAYNQAQINDGAAPDAVRYSTEQLDAYKNHSDAKLFPDVDWVKEAVRNTSPLSQNYVVNASGATKNVKFFVNLGYQNAKGIYKEVGEKDYDANNSFERFHFRSNLDISLMHNFSVKVGLSGNMDNINAPYAGDDAIWKNFYTFNPNTSPIYAKEGVWGGTNAARNNPVAFINAQGYKHTHRRLFQTNICLDYDFSQWVKGLRIGAKAAYDGYYSVDNGFSKSFAVQEVLGVLPEEEMEAGEDRYIYGNVFGTESILAAFGPSNQVQYNYDSIEGYIDYQNTFGKHDITAKAVYHQNNWQDGKMSYSPERRVNFSGLINYVYGNRYLLDLAVQFGGSEKFIRGSRFGWFPAVGLGWVVSNEKFMTHQSVVDFLKLRASGGIVGNQNVGGTRFGYRQLYTAYGSWNSGPSNTAMSAGYNEADLGNVLLKWEDSKKVDVGFDLTLWKSLNMSFTYYLEKRYDILNSASGITPNFLGAKFSYVNWGEVKNTGYEFTISYDRQFENWGFHVAANAAYSDNKVTNAAEVSQDEYTLSTIWIAGYRINQLIGSTWKGFYTKEDIESGNYKTTYGSVIPGSLAIDDYGAIGKDPDIPEWDLGFNLGMNVKGFYMNAHFQGVIGMTINMRSSAPLASSPLYSDGTNVYNVHAWVTNPWTEEAASNPKTAALINAPSFTLQNARINRVTSTFWLKNGDFVRLRSVEFGHKWKGLDWGNHKEGSIDVFIRGVNLLTISHMKYFDPEVLEGYPLMKSYNFGVKFEF